MVVGGAHRLHQGGLFGLKVFNELGQAFELLRFLVAHSNLVVARARLGCGLGLRSGGCGRFDGFGTLLKPVRIAADVFAPEAVAFRGEHLCHDVVEEAAVMADENDRAGVGRKRLFEHLQRVDVEVVRRLVEHEEIGGQGEQAGEQQAVAFAAGERAHGHVHASRREKEVTHVGDDVLLLAADLHPLGTWGDRFGDGLA